MPEKDPAGYSFPTTLYNSSMYGGSISTSSSDESGAPASGAPFFKRRMPKSASSILPMTLQATPASAMAFSICSFFRNDDHHGSTGDQTQRIYLIMITDLHRFRFYRNLVLPYLCSPAGDLAHFPDSSQDPAFRDIVHTMSSYRACRNTLRHDAYQF